MKTFLLVSSFLVATSLFPQPAPAGASIDCPLRSQHYSIDSPLIDLLLKPDAKALIVKEIPAIEHFPAQMFGTAPPSFAAIMSLRTLAAWTRTPDDTLTTLDTALTAMPLTAADEEARCARYDIDRPNIRVPTGAPRLLLFEKITGFRDGPSVEAASQALRDMAQRNGWALVQTDKGGAITSAILKKFDAVIWNNISGDVLTLKERDALRRYVEGGGGFVAFHGSAGDPVTFWDWYVDTLIGARFKNHPMNPQFQEARIQIEDGTELSRGIGPAWSMTDEWYSFENNPRASGAHVIATLDETTYSPEGMGGQDLHMGDHPIAWTRCVGAGRSFYSAIGHRPETYADPHYVQLLQQAIQWAARGGTPKCPSAP